MKPGLALLALLLPVGLQAADGELHLSFDAAPRRYDLHAGGAGTTNAFDGEGTYTRSLGAFIDMVVPMPHDGFNEHVFPVGGIGLGYAYRSASALVAQDIDLRFHYGLAIRPVQALRLDLQVHLAPSLTIADLDTRVRPSASGHWLLSGGAAGAEAVLGWRAGATWGLLLRGGVETRYVSGSNDRDNVTLRESGPIAGAGVFFAW